MRVTAARFLAALACSLLLCAAPGASQTRSGAITGRVVTDGGEPLAGATINVWSVGGAGGSRTASTDEEGRFAVADLEAGAYSVAASAPGYVTKRAPPGTEEADAYYRRPGDSFTLTLLRGGVITGRVTNRQGEPVVGIIVRAVRVRDEEGRPADSSGFYRIRRTDDRGIYRLYGLEPGGYVVLASGGDVASMGSFYPGVVNPFDGDAPTYHPSATRDTATEIAVGSGTETSGIDIRYRGEPGRTISGKITGVTDDSGDSFSGVSIILTNAASGTVETTQHQSRGEGSAFSFGGVADGEYEIIARRSSRNGTSAASAPRRVTVRGADVTGVELSLAPLASIDGSLRIEPTPAAAATGGEGACRAKGAGAAPEEVVLIARPVRADANEPSRRAAAQQGLPSPDGRFALRGLEPGRYHVEVRPPGDDLYVRSIAAPARATAKAGARSQAAESPAGEFDVSAGASVQNVRVALASGAASLAGRVSGASDAAPLPARLRVYLVPAASEHADHAWRYYETIVAPDGTWRLRRLAPGSYRLLVRAADAELNERAPRLLTHDAAGRAELRRASATGEKIDLTECQRLADHIARYGSAAPAAETRK